MTKFFYEKLLITQRKFYCMKISLTNGIWHKPVQQYQIPACLKLELVNGAFTLPDSDSDKVSDSDKITVHSYETQIRIGNKIGIGSVSANTGSLFVPHLLLYHILRRHPLLCRFCQALVCW